MVNIDKIKTLAKEKGISISHLCAKVGMGRGYLSDVKNGKNTMTEDRLVIIAEALNTTKEYLTDKTEQKNKPITTEDDELNEYLEMLRTRPELKMMFNLAKGATKADVEKSVKIIEAFLADK